MRYILFTTLLLISAINAQDSTQFYFGADVSYINEMEGCGGVFREKGELGDAYAILANHGTNMARMRLWHNPDWTNYSNFTDVLKTIRRARAQGMEILLDFHYSDDWADPDKQYIPAAWKNVPFETLVDSVYQYTRSVLTNLHKEGLLPEFVQTGNEINHGMLLPEGDVKTWDKLGALLNAGLRAVREVAQESAVPVKTVLHVAQPEHVMAWLQAALSEGKVADFDVIGLSYYAKWSSIPLNELEAHIRKFKSTFQKEVMVVETAYPWTMDGCDEANNILGADALEEGFPATPEGQKQYLIAMTQAIINGGGNGIIYWEPAWISTPCTTRWGNGSHWENATFFDFHNGNNLLPGIEYIRHAYSWKNGRKDDE